MLATHKELTYKLAELERKIGTHDEAIRSFVSAIRQLMAPPAAGQKKIGFQPLAFFAPWRETAG
jgi:hypothetical protein